MMHVIRLAFPLGQYDRIVVNALPRYLRQSMADTLEPRSFLADAFGDPPTRLWMWCAPASLPGLRRRAPGEVSYQERAWKMQVRCTALFGPQVEETFLLIQRARRQIEVSAEMLFHDPEPTFKNQDNLETWNRFRADVWPAYGSLAKGGDEVGQKLSEFKTTMENLCRPIIDREYGRVPRKGVVGRVADWLGMS